jgi:hypothetical protein
MPKPNRRRKADMGTEKSRDGNRGSSQYSMRKRLFRRRDHVPIAAIFQLILHNAGKVVPILVIGINYLRQ